MAALEFDAMTVAPTRAVPCPCGASLVLRTGRYGSYYLCERAPECENGQRAAKNGEPVGSLTSGAARRARVRAHTAFDPLWLHGAFTSRRAAYEWLSRTLGTPYRMTHMSLFDEAMCERVVEAVHLFLGKSGGA